MTLKLAHKEIELADIWFKYLYPELVRFSISNGIGIEWKNNIIEISEQNTQQLVNLLEKNLKELLDECYKEPPHKQISKNPSRFKKIYFNEKEYVLNYRTDIVGIVGYGLSYLILEVKNKPI